MSPVEYHPEAVAELRASARDYERQQTGLGERFVAVIEFALGGIVDAPLTWPVLEQDVHRKLTCVFPTPILHVEPIDLLGTQATRVAPRA